MDFSPNMKSDFSPKNGLFTECLFFLIASLLPVWGILTIKTGGTKQKNIKYSSILILHFSVGNLVF